MSLLLKKLQNCKIGETIQLVTVDDERFTGVITDKDDEDIALLDGEEELIVKLSEIKLFKKNTDNVSSHSYNPPDKEKAVSKKISDSFSFETEILSIHMPDLMINQAYGEINANDKKKLTSFYNRFRYGCKNNEIGKCMEACLGFSKAMCDNDLSSPEVYKLLAYMKSRTQNPEAEAYLKCGCYSLAAIEYYVIEKYDYACACGAIALANKEESTYYDMALTAFAKATVKMNDVGGLYYAINKNSDLLTDRKIAEILNKVFSLNNKSYSNGMDKVRVLAELNEISANSKVRKLIGSVVGEESAAGGDTKPESSGKTVGSIVKLSWVSEKGIIEADGEQYSFKYTDITDNKLTDKLRKVLTADLKANDKTIPVEFDINGYAAKNITLHKSSAGKKDFTTEKTYSYLKKGRDINADHLNKNRFYDSLPYFEKAIEVDENKAAAVTEAINCCLAIANQEETSDYLYKAYDYYIKNKELMDGKDLHSIHNISILGDLFLKLDKKEDYVACVDRILLNPNLLESTRMHYTFMKSETLIKIAMETDDVELGMSYYERAKNELRSWESQYNNSFSANTNKAMRKLYYSRVLYNIAFCLYKTGDLETAEEILNTVIKNDPDNEKAKPLMTELLELKGSDYEVHNEYKKEDGEEQQKTNYSDTPNKPEDNYDDPSMFFSDCSYNECSGWENLGISDDDVLEYLLNIKGSQRFPFSLTYLKAVSSLNSKFLSLYLDLSYALDNPMESLDYTLSNLVISLDSSVSASETVSLYCIASAYLRSVFYNNSKPDYIKAVDYISPEVAEKLPTIKPTLEELENFKLKTGIGIDRFADYRFVNDGSAAVQRNEIIREASELYDRYFTRRFNEDIKQKRFKITKILIFQKDGLLGQAVLCAKNNDYAGFADLKDTICKKFMKNGMPLSVGNIQPSKIDDYINENWNLAGKDPRVYERKTSNLMGDLFNNLSSAVNACVSFLCKWANFCESELNTLSDEDFALYQKTKGKVVPLLESVISECKSSSFEADAEIEYGCSLVENVCAELIDRLNGDWNYNRRKYYFCDFLRTDNILLDDRFIPDLTSTFCDLKTFNVIQRICNHISSEDATFVKHAESIYLPDAKNHDYGTARQIAEYLAYKNPDNAWKLPENEVEFDEQGKQQLWKKFEDFNFEICLAYNQGQLDPSDVFLNTIQETAQFWYQYCMTTKNYGFFVRFVDCCLDKAHDDAIYFGKILTKQLDELAQKKNLDQTIVDEIAGYIEKQFFSIVEDMMFRISKDDFDSESRPPEDVIECIKQFWLEFDGIYNSVKETGFNLRYVVTNDKLASKDRRGGTAIINNWLNNGNRSNPEKIQRLLELLGWNKIAVSDESKNNKEIYHVSFTEKVVGRIIYQHPISAFGTDAANDGFHVVCLYGYTNADRLFDEYQKLDAIVGNKIILLDYALCEAERRKLARITKIKPLASTYLLVDRVAIMYIANHYISGGNNRTLMSITAPFSYVQPYIEGATNKVPAEMFIGRTDELLSIESSTGANLVYGGRQLGKSALLRKAEQEIDNREAKRYAVVIDIVKLNSAQAALKISKELAKKENSLISEDDITDDWYKLTESISNSIENNDIGFFLLMIDEADSMIEDCMNDDFIPIVCLKDIQQKSRGKFKYVLAGLHNVVRFNRSVSLGNNSVIAHLSSINVSPFEYEDAKELLTKPLSYLGFEFEDESLIVQILSATNYFPSLIQLYCKKLIESLKRNYAGYNENDTPPYKITESVIGRVLSDENFKEEIKRKFSMTIELTTDYYLTTLILASLFCDDVISTGYTAMDINNAAVSILGSTLCSNDDIQNYLEELCELNILKKIDDKYSFRTKSFRDMLGSKEQIEDEIIKKLAEND